MASDAHIHPYYLIKHNEQCEDERCAGAIRCAASACGIEEFLHNEEIAGRADTPEMVLCFAIHPQLPTMLGKEKSKTRYDVPNLLAFLHKLARQQRIACIGEMGFDLYGDYKQTEREQTVLFEEQLQCAIEYETAIVLHVRRALHKVFAYTNELRRVNAVVFHSFAGPLDDARSLLRRGINAYFSFGTALLNNHHNAIKSCAELDADRILFETDAPYQPSRGKSFSSYNDIYAVIEAAARLRSVDAAELTARADANFTRVFGNARR